MKTTCSQAPNVAIEFSLRKIAGELQLLLLLTRRQKRWSVCVCVYICVWVRDWVRLFQPLTSMTEQELNLTRRLSLFPLYFYVLLGVQRLGHYSGGAQPGELYRLEEGCKFWAGWKVSRESLGPLLRTGTPRSAHLWPFQTPTVENSIQMRNI